MKEQFYIRPFPSLPVVLTTTVTLAQRGPATLEVEENRKYENKKTREQELDQESDQENKKTRRKTRTRPRKRPRKKEKTFFLSFDHFLGRVLFCCCCLVFLLSCFLL